MLHLFPDAASDSRPQAYAEAVGRLASVRQALRLVDPFAGGPASDLEDDASMAAAWHDVGESKRRLFGSRSAQLVGATAAGVEALLSERERGREPHAEASKALVDQIRRELSAVSSLILR
jgi:hypothetical protein